MIGPKRLLDGEGTELERILLSAGRDARPRSRARWRTGMLFVLLGTGAVSKARAAALLGTKVRAWTVAQWLALGAVSGGAGWGVIHASKVDISPGPSVSAVSVTKTASPSTPSEALVPQLDVPTSPPSAAAVETAPDQSPSTLNSSRVARPSPQRQGGGTAVPVQEPSLAARSIASEVEELDQARQALSSAQPKRALEKLDRYQRLFPKGVLQQEAMRLRIEALVSAGEHASARALAHEFQARYPSSTHSDRLKSLLREP